MKDVRPKKRKNCRGERVGGNNNHHYRVISPILIKGPSFSRNAIRKGNSFNAKKKKMLQLSLLLKQGAVMRERVLRLLWGNRIHSD